MQRIDLYKAYLEHQAANHPDLGHDPDNNVHVFQMIDIEEAFGDFRNKAKSKSYIMRGINYTYEVGQRQHEHNKYIQGGFLVAKFVSPRGDSSENYYTAMRDAERVTDEIIEKIIADSQNGHPLFEHSLDSNQDFSVAPMRYYGDGSYAGWRCIFSFHNFFRSCIDHADAPAWADNGTTPFNLLAT